MESSSALKKKEVLTNASTWMDLEDILLREISQTLKDRYCALYFYVVPRALGLRHKVEQSSPGAGKRGRELLLFDGYGVSVGRMNYSDGCTTI